MARVKGSKNVPAEVFVKAWQEAAGDVATVVEKTGLKENTVRQRARNMVKKGVPLVAVVANVANKLDFDEIAQVVQEAQEETLEVSTAAA